MIKPIECDLAQLGDIASQLALSLKIGDIVCLYGDLGAGKTTFARAIIQALLPDIQDITSPTFNLVHVYDAKQFQIWHFDLYRLKNIKEIHNLAIDDAFRYGVSIIEWPEIIQDILPIGMIEIQLKFTNNPSTRLITIGQNS